MNIHSTNFLSLYTDAKEGGCIDVAQIRLEGFTLVDNKDLARLKHYAAVLEAEPLPSHVVEVLRLALRAISGPRGSRPKTQKGIDAYEAIRDLLATAPIQRETT